MDFKTIIIAEAGVNHNGSLETARQMVDEAAKAGADYIKFQTFKADKLVTKTCKAAGYQSENCSVESQDEMLRSLELTEQEFFILNQYCKNKGIGFLSTPFDEESIEFISSLKPDFMKVPSGEITDLPYLRKMASTGISMIISTGMSTMKDIKNALVPFIESGYTADNLYILHCTTQYPTPYEDVNLLAIKTLSEKFGFPVGYSDHTRGIEVPIAAVALGALIIEKHFTISRNMKGPDHRASLEPKELAEMVRGIRNVEIALGNGEKIITDSEKSNIKAARRSIVSKKFIRKGEIITEDKITVKRPGDGLSPMLWDSILGTQAIRDFNPDELIEI